MHAIYDSLQGAPNAFLEAPSSLAHPEPDLEISESATPTNNAMALKQVAIPIFFCKNKRNWVIMP